MPRRMHLRYTKAYTIRACPSAALRLRSSGTRYVESRANDAGGARKAWGITREWLVLGLVTTAYYTGFEALSRAHDAVGDLFAEE